MRELDTEEEMQDVETVQTVYSLWVLIWELDTQLEYSTLPWAFVWTDNRGSPEKQVIFTYGRCATSRRWVGLDRPQITGKTEHSDSGLLGCRLISALTTRHPQSPDCCSEDLCHETPQKKAVSYKAPVLLMKKKKRLNLSGKKREKGRQEREMSVLLRGLSRPVVDQNCI
jgi:hypothetical protein